jgi:transcriptional regulator with XRE-family HTH domain
MDVREFGQKVYRLRMAKKWTQVGCATRAQISIGTLQMIEAYKVRPTVDTVRKLALAFGCSWEDLLGPVKRPESVTRKAKAIRRGL